MRPCGPRRLITLPVLGSLGEGADSCHCRAAATVGNYCYPARMGHGALMLCPCVCVRPELLSKSRLTRSADVYSFGMLMWEICTGEVKTLIQSPSCVWLSLSSAVCCVPAVAHTRASLMAG